MNLETLGVGMVAIGAALAYYWWRYANFPTEHDRSSRWTSNSCACTCKELSYAVKNLGEMSIERYSQRFNCSWRQLYSF